MARKKQPPSVAHLMPKMGELKPKKAAPQRQNGGRKPDPANRGIAVMVRLHPSYLALTNDACKAAGVDRSTFIRTIFVAEMQRLGYFPPQKKG
jgi:hypothetical protein